MRDAITAEAHTSLLLPLAPPHFPLALTSQDLALVHAEGIEVD